MRRCRALVHDREPCSGRPLGVVNEFLRGVLHGRIRIVRRHDNRGRTSVAENRDVRTQRSDRGECEGENQVQAETPSLEPRRPRRVTRAPDNRGEGAAAPFTTP